VQSLNTTRHLLSFSRFPLLPLLGDEANTISYLLHTFQKSGACNRVTCALNLYTNTKTKPNVNILQNDQLQFSLMEPKSFKAFEVQYETFAQFS